MKQDNSRVGSKTVLLQPRDRLALEALAQRRILTRNQLAILVGFNSISRINVRLSKLLSARLLVRYFTASDTGSRKAVYALSRQGAAEIQHPYRPLKWPADSVVVGNAFIAHHLALNDVYLAATDQKNREVKWWEPATDELLRRQLIPDALIEDANAPQMPSLFLEVDLGTEALPTWSRKAKNYLELASSGRFHSMVHGSQFAVLVVTANMQRCQSLREFIARITPKLFWFSTLPIIKQRGFWSPVWLRPSGDQLVPPGQ